MTGRKDSFLRLIIAIFLFAGLISCEKREKKPVNIQAGEDWPEYLGDGGRAHYSTLEQINKKNVTQLDVAWVYHTGDFGEMQCNPLVIDGVLYGTTAACEVFALDAATGKEKWRFAPSEKKNYLKSRGVSYWGKGNDRRILFTYDEWLYALDAGTGKPVITFGENGSVSLKTGLGERAKDRYVMSRTPGTVYRNLIIMPLVVSRVPGYIQAFNVETGDLEWIFHTIPRPDEYGVETWPDGIHKNDLIGGANNWAGMALDKERGIVYVPTGSAHSPSDFWGGNRTGENLFANTLLALDARTGERIWHYQIVHHDLLDRDLPSPPSLATIRRNGKKQDVVVQTTKTGQVFVFGRETGDPVFSIGEVSFPASELEGEQAWPTQPIAQTPKPFSRQSLTENDINPYSKDKDSLMAFFRNAKTGMYTPLSQTPTIIFPGYDGGAEWGGVAVDTNGVMYVNANEMAWVSGLSPTANNGDGSSSGPGGRVYTTYCSMCHGKDLSGNPASGYPSLKNIKQRLDKSTLSGIVSKGKGMMPGFPGISEKEKEALVAYLFEGENEKPTMEAGHVEQVSTPDIPWKFNGFKKFLDSEGMPGISPPWGTLSAINLNTGRYVWQKSFGELDDLTEKGIPPTGTENYGGPVVTAGGLLFIAATKDGYFRAYDKESGAELWKYKLPAGGYATPAVYEVDGCQYVVIACGGGKMGTKSGDSYVAFSLKNLQDK